MISWSTVCERQMKSIWVNMCNGFHIMRSIYVCGVVLLLTEWKLAKVVKATAADFQHIGLNNAGSYEAFMQVFWEYFSLLLFLYTLVLIAICVEHQIVGFERVWICDNLTLNF